MTRTTIYVGLALAALLAAAIAGYALRDGAARAQAAALTRTVEQERAAREGLTVVLAEREGALRDHLARLTAERAGLAEQLAAARRAAPSSKPTRVADLSGDATAHGTPREETGGGCPPASGAGPAPPPCLLAEGDGVRIAVAEADLVSDAGTHLVIGTGQVWRTRPGEALIASAPLRGTVRVAPSRTPPRWAASADVGVSTDGWAYAAAVERRVAGPVWAGLVGGVHGTNGYISGRLRVEW